MWKRRGGPSVFTTYYDLQIDGVEASLLVSDSFIPPAHHYPDHYTATLYAPQFNAGVDGVRLSAPTLEQLQEKALGILVNAAVAMRKGVEALAKRQPLFSTTGKPVFCIRRHEQYLSNSCTPTKNPAEILFFDNADTAEALLREMTDSAYLFTRVRESFKIDVTPKGVDFSDFKVVQYIGHGSDEKTA